MINEMALWALYGNKKGAQRPSGHLFVAIHASESHFINYSWVTMSNRCKIFYFFSFLLTFGGWQGNHFGHNFMENNSIENLEAWKSRESAENCLIRCPCKFSLFLVETDRIGLFLAIWGQNINMIFVRWNLNRTWKCLGKFISCHFQLLGVILRHFQSSAKNFTLWLFSLGPL